MRTYARIWGVIASGAGIGIVSAAGVPVIPSGVPAGQQPAIGTPTPIWVTVQTDANGSNDMVYLVTLCQVLQLNLGEDPQFVTYGIPVIQAVQQGIAPDWYVSRTQQQFSSYFASLTIQRAIDQSGNPAYDVNVMTNRGVIINAGVPLPT